MSGSPANARPFAVKEIYFTRQGEGARTGRRAVFCRFAGCNLWSGREADRATAVCDFCDTDFVGTDGPGGGVFATAAELAAAIRACWDVGAANPAPEGGAPSPLSGARDADSPYVVFTGGEPMLRLRPDLIDACHRLGVEVAVETNGTLPAPDGIDWLTVSPKAGAPLVQLRGQELKLIWPQPLEPASFEALDFGTFFLQPMDGPDYDANLAMTLAYCRAHPRWQLSVQTHKYLGLR